MDLEDQYDKIYRYCYFKLHHQQTAEDVTQETFLRFLEDHKYRENGKGLRYLYTIAHNLCVDVYRKRQTEPLKDEFSAADREGEILDRIAVKEAVFKLTKEEQEIVLLRYVNEVPVSEICSFLNVSRYSLYRKTAKALRKLQDILGKEDFR